MADRAPEVSVLIRSLVALAVLAAPAQLEAQASLIPVLVSPDRLGLVGGDFGQLGVRYTWASGSQPDPERLRKAVGGR